ncbi:DUF4190 domain-containing protein [Amycolatopsis sp. OK19-0408]|uniref:DUF4190 domain-containing protein n=1 Tax=Amycolatopsis iheyensis TaxID=2945988 RepID=A0A9X2SPE1_9PSEU|nr:DUF4190 domain-containing protein [Amycolatopsis iheyensis]MCR6488828.1 DUF4190 domain-containing protein [Amycolatopsis iheyensis]
MTEPDDVKRDSLAMPALITGLLGFLGITAALGLVFGTIALVRTREIGQAGRGLAIGGIVAAAAWIAVLSSLPFLLFTGSVLSASNAPIAVLEVDNCYNTARPGADAARVPCEGEHDGVVLDAYTMTKVAYPGERVARADAQRGCEDRLASRFTGELPPDLEIVGYPPTEASWIAGKQLAVCGLQSRSGPLFGPLPH